MWFLIGSGHSCSLVDMCGMCGCTKLGCVWLTDGGVGM
jgi:hypothetical protein